MIETVVALLMYISFHGLHLLDRINKHLESMALNKVNIEFLRGQMDKALEDIEKLKDANREMRYTNGGTK